MTVEFQKNLKADVPLCYSWKTYFPCFLIQFMTLSHGWKGYSCHSAFSRSDLILDQNILSDEILQDTINDESVQVLLIGLGKVNRVPVN